MKEINLFESYLAAHKTQTRLTRSIKVVSFVFLIGYVLVASTFFSYALILKRQNENLGEKIKKQEEKIKQLNQTETLHAFVKQRLQALVSFFGKKRVDYQKAMVSFSQLTPDEISLKSFQMDNEGNLKIDGHAINAVVLANFLDRLIAPATDNFIKKIELSSAKRGEDGSYSFSLSLNVKS